MADISDQDVSDILENHIHNEKYQDSGWYTWQEYFKGHEPVFVPDLGAVEVVADEREDTDYTAGMILVFKVSFWDGTEAHYRLDGTYRSYDGSEWHSPAYKAQYGERKVMDWIAVTS